MSSTKDLLPSLILVYFVISHILVPSIKCSFVSYALLFNVPLQRNALPADKMLMGERKPGGTAWERMREKEILEQSGQNSPLCKLGTIHRMSNLQKYRKAKKESQQHLWMQSWWRGTIDNAEGNVKRQIAPFTGGWCALCVGVRWKGVKFRECVLLNLWAYL